MIDGNPRSLSLRDEGGRCGATLNCCSDGGIGFGTDGTEIWSFDVTRMGEAGTGSTEGAAGVASPPRRSYGIGVADSSSMISSVFGAAGMNGFSGEGSVMLLD